MQNGILPLGGSARKLDQNGSFPQKAVHAERGPVEVETQKAFRTRNRRQGDWFEGGTQRENARNTKRLSAKTLENAIQ